MTYKLLSSCKSKRYIFILIVIILFAMAIYRIKPAAVNWSHPISPDSFNNHHSIVSIIDDLYKDPNFLQGDLVVEAIKKYFLLYKDIQNFFVNILGIDIQTFVNICIISGVLLNFAGLAYFTYVIAGKKTAVILSLLLFIGSPESVLLDDTPVNFMRVMAQGICWLSLAYFFRERYVASLFLCAGAFAFHYGMPFYLALCYFFYFLLRIRMFSFKQLAIYSSVFLLSVSLVSIDLFRMQMFPHDSSGYDYTLWKKIIQDTASFWSYKVSYNYLVNDLSFNINKLRNPILKNLIIPALFFLAAYRMLRFGDKFIFIFISYLLVQLIHFISLDVFFIPPLIRPVLINAGYYMPFFMIAIYSSLIIKVFYDRTTRWKELLAFYLLTIIYLAMSMKEPIPLHMDYFLLTPLFIIFSWLIYRYMFTINVGVSVGKYSAPLILSALFCIILAYYTSLASYVIQKAKAPEYTTWLDVQTWANRNTDKSNRFIIPFTPHQMFGMPIYGKRSSMSFKRDDIHFIVSLDPNLTKRAVREYTWAWPGPKKDGIPLNFTEYSLKAAQNYVWTSINKEGLMAIKKEFPTLSYIITEGYSIPGLPLVYINKDFSVFKII